MVSWSVVVPVKALGAAKSRLRADRPLGDISGLALAFAVDTVTAALAAASVREVVVVSSDPDVAERMRALGARLVADPGSGLDAAASAGIAACDGPIAVLTGDLPALRPTELDAALRRAESSPLAVVPDREGSGTTMITAHEPGSLHPRFGVGSHARHVAAGHVDIDAGESLRADVDTEHDLRHAVGLGVGPATVAALG